MPSLSKQLLHTRLIEAAGCEVIASSDLAVVPLKTRFRSLGAVTFYAFTMTAPPGGRPVREYKIQLILPGQTRGQRGQLDIDPDGFTVITGWSEEDGVFALWDGYAYSSFGYSRNLQVKGEPVWTARSSGLSICERRLRRSEGMETVVVCRKDQLLAGLRSRLEYSARRLSHNEG